MPGEIDSPRDEPRAFAFEQASLQCRLRLAYEDMAPGAHDAVPRDTVTRGAGGHRAASGARATAQPDGSRELAVGENTPARNLFHQAVDGAPGHVFSGKTPSYPVWPVEASARASPRAQVKNPHLIRRRARAQDGMPGRRTVRRQWGPAGADGGR